MSRLTEKVGNEAFVKELSGYTSVCFGCERIGRCKTKCSIYNAIQKLSKYEDVGLEPEHIDSIVGQLLGYLDAEELEKYELEQGLLIKLPCKVGDVFYINIQNKTYECKISGFYIIKDEIQFMVSFPDEDNKTWYEIGETHRQEELFSTQEEAEKALEASNVE